MNNIVGIGRITHIQYRRLTIQVRVMDIKEVRGHKRYLVKPIAGDGLQWVKRLVKPQKESA